MAIGTLKRSGGRLPVQLQPRVDHCDCRVEHGVLHAMLCRHGLHQAVHPLDVWRAGTARVKLEVVQSPKPIETGGRWCIQIGAFRKHLDALEMKDRLTQQYRPSRVLEFAGSTGYWVRVQVKDDDRNRTKELASKLQVEEGGVFLVRLD